MVHNKIQLAIEQQGLDDNFTDTVQQWYEPLAREVAESAQQSRCFTLGIQGCQGSGKSTLASFLKIILEETEGLNVAVVSLDDFYCTLDDRQTLANTVHPLLITRGVPGTHDLVLAEQTFNTLKSLQAHETCSLPLFNKAIDDRAPQAEWPTIEGPVDIIIFEGWCLGASPQNNAALTPAINELEENEDHDGRWRAFVNAQLSSGYATLFSHIDKLAVLNAPSFECVYDWRALQEEKLRQKVSAEKRAQTKVLNSDELQRFISHYERLTRHCIATLPTKANWLLPLNAQHHITGLISQA